MHLVNFRPISDGSAHGFGIALNAFGVEWDLHNYADFDGFDYSTAAAYPTLTLRWHITKQAIEWCSVHGVPNAARIPAYPSHRFCLVFSDVYYLEVAPRDVEMPSDEDKGISSVSCVEANGDKLSKALPCKVPCEGIEPFHLLFQFNGGQIIRIGAEKAEFVLLDD